MRILDFLYAVLMLNTKLIYGMDYTVMRLGKVICGVCVAAVVTIVAVALYNFSGNTGENDADTQEEIVENNAQDIMINGTVKLNTINQPMFEDVIAELEYNGITVDVQWGIGDLYYMWYKSGYPGFGYSMVIQSPNVVVGTGNAVLATEYGRYVYRYKETLQAYCKDDTLYWAGDNSMLSNFGVMSEILYLYNPSNHSVQVYTLVEQTEIIL